MAACVFPPCRMVVRATAEASNSQHRLSHEPVCSPLIQYRVLFARFAKAYWRNPAVNLSRLGAAVVSAFLIGTWYWMLGDNYGSRADTRVRTTWFDKFNVNHGLQPVVVALFAR